MTPVTEIAAIKKGRLMYKSVLSVFFMSGLLISGTGLPATPTGSEGSRDLESVRMRWTTSASSPLDLLSRTPWDKIKESAKQVWARLGETRWRGFYFKDLVSKVIEPLELNQQALVDLVVIRSESGQEVSVPRAFLNRYDVLLASEKKIPGKINTRVAASVVLEPKSSSVEEKLKREVLPWKRYAVEGIQEIVLTSYRDYFDRRYFVLDSRDPTVIRGQRRFVQNCLSCHSPRAKSMGGKTSPATVVRQVRTKWEKSFQKHVDQTHSGVAGMARFSDLDGRSILRYLDLISKKGKTLASQTDSENRFSFKP